MAGLFALLYGIFSVTDNIVSNAKDDVYCAENKKIAIEKGNKTYFDSYGYEHFVDNDELCKITWNKNNGHRVIESINSKGLPTGRIFYDFDKEKEITEEEQFQHNIEEAIKLGYKYAKCKFITDASTFCTGYEIESKRRYYVKCDTNGKCFLYYVTDEPILKSDLNGNVRKYYKCINSEIKYITKEEYKERLWWEYK